MNKKVLAFAASLVVGATIAMSMPTFAGPGLGAGLGAKAHAGKRGGDGARLQKMTEQLGLTADQKTKIGDILKAELPRLKAIHDSTTLSDEDKKAQMKTERKAMNEQIKAILTPDQLAKMKELRKNRPGPKPAAA